MDANLRHYCSDTDIMTDLGITTDVEALRKIFNPENLSLVDVGCGNGDLARKLAYVGATICGVEPDAVQAEKNAQAEPVKNVTFCESRANQLPMEDNSVDGLMFSLSLHHIPQIEMQASLDEAFRVIKPTGFLAAIEPLLEGTHNYAIELFHDETEVRQQAIQALSDFAKPYYTNWQQYYYTTEKIYENFEDFANHYSDRSYSSSDTNIIRSDAVRARFESAREGDQYILRQPMRIDFFTHPN